MRQECAGSYGESSLALGRAFELGMGGGKSLGVTRRVPPLDPAIGLGREDRAALHILIRFARKEQAIGINGEMGEIARPGLIEHVEVGELVQLGFGVAGGNQFPKE